METYCLCPIKKLSDDSHIMRLFRIIYIMHFLRLIFSTEGEIFSKYKVKYVTGRVISIEDKVISEDCVIG